MRLVALEPDAADVMSRAEATARQRQHRAITPLHVLVASLTIDSLWYATHPLALMRNELAALVSARLDACPMAEGYREGAPAELRGSHELDALLVSDHLILTERIDAAALTDRILADEELARLVTAGGLDFEPLAASLDRAEALAKGRGHRLIHAEHVLRVLTDQRWFARVVEAGGGDASAVRSRLDAELDGFNVVDAKGFIEPSPSLSAILKTAGRLASASHEGLPTSVAFLISALGVVDLRGLAFGEALSLGRILLVLVSANEPALDADVPVDVVFHGPSTSGVFISFALETFFGLPRSEAATIRDRLRIVDEVSVARLPRSEARGLVLTALRFARAEGISLRITTRAVPGAPSGA